MAKKYVELSESAFGYAAAAVSAVCMLLLGIGWKLGIYSTAAQAMADWHLFFGPSIMGIIGGMVEAAIWSFIAAYAFAWVYNKKK